MQNNVVWEKLCGKRGIFKVHRRSDEDPKRRGRPLGKWKDRVKEYVSERGVRGNGSGQGGSV